MSDDQLDDEAPPSIPDIGSQPEVAPIPELPSEIPPPPSAEAKTETELPSEVDVDVDDPSDPEAVFTAAVVPAVPPPRKRTATNPATPIARASMPAPSTDEDDIPTSNALKPPRTPSIADLDEPTTRIDDESEFERTTRRLDPALTASDLDLSLIHI